MSKADTGESTARIIARMNESLWRAILPAMLAGGELRKGRGVPYYYCGGQGGLTAAKVRKLEAEGVIVRVGVDTYKLAVSP